MASFLDEFISSMDDVHRQEEFDAEAQSLAFQQVGHDSKNSMAGKVLGT